ncbi:hypothetical protein SM007_27480 [Streptomyces avermitilis]|uniref:Uncharacterized protein n=1 Tax=Streptomyces avermitilis (strain ATCC 31267 / DSM 46492 / JCM 5070 / NBRC 14893 / NCIMB 12804 / NRRL 8165 / MA-4680) TaxID=227882 RepID=Q82YA2_STRAW|nr:hypothetical protein SM007_27480 [Streptomyces avermitilis]BAC75363.1 hypothetical protein SAVERM_1p79 [Streptomyces avermitilis MA-4680 = NBRC 14893]
MRTTAGRRTAPRAPGAVTASVVRAPAHRIIHRGAHHRPHRTAPGARHGAAGSYITHPLVLDLIVSPDQR